MRRFLVFFAFVMTSLCSAQSPGCAAPAPSEGSVAIDAQLQTLEKRFFQHPFNREPLNHRITRMEKFTFGDVHKGTAEERISRLVKVLEEAGRLGPAEVAAMKQKQAATARRTKSAGKATDGTIGNYPHITFLEHEILGKTYDGTPITQRLSRLELHTFGAVSASDDLRLRTDALEHYAEEKLHKRPFVKEKVRSHRTARFGNHNPYTARSRSKYRDHIASLRNTPPPPHSRMLARLSWCEQHVFGKTFSQMHLLDRLHQLNQNLNPGDKHTDMQLMDKMDDLVREVVMRQHPRKVASS